MYNPEKCSGYTYLIQTTVPTFGHEFVRNISAKIGYNSLDVFT